MPKNALKMWFNLTENIAHTALFKIIKINKKLVKWFHVMCLKIYSCSINKELSFEAQAEK